MLRNGSVSVTTQVINFTYEAACLFVFQGVSGFGPKLACEETHKEGGSFSLECACLVLIFKELEYPGVVFGQSVKV